MDIHKRARKLQRALQRLDASSISEGNKDTIKQFECYLTQEEYSAGRRQKYVEQLTKIASWLDKPFKVASKPDIIDIMVKVGEQGYKEWTKHDYKVTLKVFFKWLRFGSIENDEYPEEVKWIKSRMKNSSRKLPEEILTEDEVQRMAEACTNSRDKAFILVLYDCGGRIGEILSLKIKDVTFDRYGAVLILDGKTGMRRVRIIASAPALSHWLSDHPLKNTSDAPLWTMFTEREKIKPVSYAAMRKVILEATRNAEPPIKKRVHPHLFRHSRATDLANIMTERQMESYLGWSPGSRMPSVYVHLSGKEVDPVLLRSQGIAIKEQKSEPSLKLTKCPRCHENNSPGVRFCRRCGSPMDTRTAVEMEEARTKICSIMDMLFEDEEFRKFLKRKIASLS